MKVDLILKFAKIQRVLGALRNFFVRHYKNILLNCGTVSENDTVTSH